MVQHSHRRAAVPVGGPSARPSGAAAWSSEQAPAGVEDRMLALTYRVARQVGYPRRAGTRLCRRIILDTPSWREDRPEGAGRRGRARLVTTLRAALGPHVDPDRLDRAVSDAVLADEITLLPTRQQAVLRWVVEQQCTVGQVIERTGWTHQQVARLLRAGLTTLTVCGRSG
jgi:hypothetical protein